MSTILQEPLFLNPDNKRIRYPIGWLGKGRYKPGTLTVIKVSDNSNIPITEEDNGVFYNFNSPLGDGVYTDYTVSYEVRDEDLEFSEGTIGSKYEGEEYFLFPNWLEAPGVDVAFWVGKYIASRRDSTTTNKGVSNIPVSMKNKRPWTNNKFYLVPDCIMKTKGKRFHMMLNREWTNIAFWMHHFGFDNDIKGNIQGYSNLSNADGAGTNATSFKDGENGKTLTGMGPNTWNHNLLDGGITDIIGNVWEQIEGIRIYYQKNYVVYNENNEYDITKANSNGIVKASSGNISYINDFDNNLLDENFKYDALPISDSNGINVSVQGDYLDYSKGNNPYSICYRSGSCFAGAHCGVWALGLSHDRTYSSWHRGFRLVAALSN